MGCVLSSKASSNFNTVRVVHLNGYVEDFFDPITVKDITGKPSKHVICSSAHLLSFGTQPLGPEAELVPGRVYFLLPNTVFMSDSSPVDLAALATRLTMIATRGSGSGSRSGSESGPGFVPTSWSMKVKDRPVQGLYRQPAGSPGSSPGRELGGLDRAGSRVDTWKPILETIEEKSMGGSMRSFDVAALTT